MNNFTHALQNIQVGVGKINVKYHMSYEQRLRKETHTKVGSCQTRKQELCHRMQKGNFIKCQQDQNITQRCGEGEDNVES